MIDEEWGEIEYGLTEMECRDPWEDEAMDLEWEEGYAEKL